MAPSWSQDGPNRPQDGSRRAQEALRGPKMAKAPRGPQEGPKRSSKSLKMGCWSLEVLEFLGAWVLGFQSPEDLGVWGAPGLEVLRSGGVGKVVKV